jgi:hypothetical protein
MNGFQEQQLFTGAAQVQGFAPEQAVDTTIGLRESFEVQNRNFQAQVAATQRQNELKLEKDLRNYELLGQFAPKLKELGQFAAKAYLDSQAVQAQDDAIKLGELASFGITSAEEEEFKTIETQASKEGFIANDAANTAAMQGASTEAINYLKSLPKYRQLYATQYWIQQKATEYPEFHRQFLLRPTLYTDPRDNSQFTAQEVGVDKVRAGIVNAAARKAALVEQVGISQGFNPNKVLMRPFYKAATAQDQVYSNQIQEAKNVQDSFEIKASANQAFITAVKGDNTETKALSFSALIAGNRNLRVNQNGKYRTLTNNEAITQAYEDVVNMYDGGHITRLEAESILKQSVKHAPGKKYGEFYRERSENFIDELDKVDSNRRKAKNLQQSDFKEQLNAQLIDFIQGGQWDGNPETLRQAKEELIAAANQNGIYDYSGSVADTYIATESRRQNRETVIEMLTQAQKNQTLTTKMLMNSNVPQDLRKQFMPEAMRQDDIRGRILPEKDVESDFTTALKTALGDSSLDANFIGLRSAKFAAMREYRKLVNQLEPAMGAEAAAVEAKQRVEDMIINGKGVFELKDWKDKPAGSSATSYWPRFTPVSGMSQGEAYDKKKYIEAYNKDNTIIDSAPMVPISTLESVAAQIRAGVPVDVPGIYRELGGNPTDLLNRNLAAINRNERMVYTPANVIESKTQDANLKRLARKARSIFDQQRVQAAYEGATTDATFMNPRVVQYVSGDPAILGMNTGRIIYDERGHGGANYHNHYEFETPQQALQAVAKFKAAGFRVTSVYRPGDPGAHGARVGVDVAPPLDLPNTDKAEREWSARANAVIGFDPLGGNK